MDGIVPSLDLLWHTEPDGGLWRIPIGEGDSRDTLRQDNSLRLRIHTRNEKYS